MGYDVSFHPISPEEMREWYFTPLTWIQQGQEEKVLALAAQHGMEDFYAEKYLDTLRVGAETKPDELFDKSHGFYIAVIQGFFRDYYYTRGSSFSLLMEKKPEYVRYFTPWAQVVPTAFPGHTAPPGSGAGTKGAGRSGGSLERWAACGAEKGACRCGRIGCRFAGSH